jgi:hypothetical protein
MVQDRFFWNFEGRLDQAQSDPFAARGPTNRETVVDLTTGPRLDIPFGRTSLAVGANRRARRYEESTQNDSDSDDLQISLSRQVRPATAFALVADASETNFIGVEAPTYRINQLFVRIDRTARRSTLSADLGTNEIDSNTQSRRDPLFNVAWTRSLGARSVVGITATEAFRDTGDVGIGGSEIVTPSPFEQRSVALDYTLEGQRTIVGVGLSTGDEDYAGGTTIDNAYRSADLTIDYRVTPRLGLGFLYQWYGRDYEDASAPSTAQEDRTAGVWLNRALGRRFSIAFDLSRYEADGAQNVEEERWELRFTYSPIGTASSSLGSIGR